MTYQTVVNRLNEGSKRDTRVLTLDRSNCSDPWKDPLKVTYADLSVQGFEPPLSVTKAKLRPIESSWKHPEEDPDNFKKIRQSGAIKMSEYSTGRIREEHFLLNLDIHHVRTAISRPNEQDVHRHFWQVGGVVCAEEIRPAFSLESNSSWTEHFYLHDRMYPHFPVEPPTLDSYNTDMQAVKSQVATALQKRWDLMTDIFETRATAQQALALLHAVRRPLETAKHVLTTLKSAKASHAEIKQAWLGFRYGIMPVLYSAQDLHQELSRKKVLYQTERAKRDIDLTANSYPRNATLPQTFSYETLTGSIGIRGAGKARFSSPSGRVLHGTSLNVINSMWEVIPYSLIVDWFSNFGDWLYNQTSWMNSLSAEQRFCVSVKHDYQLTRWLSHTRRNMRHIPGWPSLEIDKTSTAEQLAYVKKVETYQRIPFTPRDVELIFDPRFASWKRWADAYAMSVGKATTLLRKLRYLT